MYSGRGDILLRKSMQKAKEKKNLIETLTLYSGYSRTENKNKHHRYVQIYPSHQERCHLPSSFFFFFWPDPITR